MRFSNTISYNTNIETMRFLNTISYNTNTETSSIPERPHRCDQCQYRSTTKGLLDKHIRTVHNKEKPFGCQICMARFGQKAHLQVKTALGSNVGLGVARWYVFKPKPPIWVNI
jgi:uncharacterized Zn-finger protein